MVSIPKQGKFFEGLPQQLYEMENNHSIAPHLQIEVDKCYLELFAQVEGRIEGASLQAVQKTLLSLSKILYIKGTGRIAPLFRASLTIAKNARMEMQPEVRVRQLLNPLSL